MTDNDVIQSIAESFYEVTEGTAKECMDLAQIAYNAACTAGMILPDETPAVRMCGLINCGRAALFTVPGQGDYCDFHNPIEAMPL